MQVATMPSSINRPTWSGQGSFASSPFVPAAYNQDPMTMTYSTPQDAAGINTYMPNLAGIDQHGNDPETNIPVFTTSKLQRSNQLSGYGKHGFLRPQFEPDQGISKLGKRYDPFGRNDADIARKRAQYNAARLRSPDDDPVLFNTSEFAYSNNDF